MVQATPLLLVLFLALGAHGISAEECSLTGSWINDLGSTMTIASLDANGDFIGAYYTAVSATSNEIKESLLLGSQQMGPDQMGQPTFGFTVHWNFSDSITVFTGQCFVEENQTEVLRAMWLLRSHADKRENDWNAT
ncbi:AVID protein, partial [Sitta europaea]|nr:AVID protein [Sitta europaea]